MGGIKMGKTKVKIMFWAVLILIIGFISPARMAKADEENESGEQTVIETKEEPSPEEENEQGSLNIEETNEDLILVESESLSQEDVNSVILSDNHPLGDNTLTDENEEPYPVSIEPIIEHDYTQIIGNTQFQIAQGLDASIESIRFKVTFSNNFVCDYHLSSGNPMYPLDLTSAFTRVAQTVIPDYYRPINATIQAVNFFAGSNDAKIIVTFDGGENVSCEIPYTLITDFDDLDNLDNIVVPLTDGMTLHEDDMLNYRYKGSLGQQEYDRGAILYVDVPYKTFVTINSENNNVRFSVNKCSNTGFHGEYLIHGVSPSYERTLWQDDSTEAVRYYILVHYLETDEPITLHVDSYELGTFEDIDDSIPVLADGYNQLDDKTFKWMPLPYLGYYMQGVREERLVKLVVPSGKSLIIEDFEAVSDSDFTGMTGGIFESIDEGKSYFNNKLYDVQATNTIDENNNIHLLTMYDTNGDKLKINRIDNNTDSDKVYYMTYSWRGKSFTISYTNFEKYKVSFYYDYPNGTPEGYADYIEYETEQEYEIYSELAEKRAEIENYRFVGWADKNGSILSDNRIYKTNKDLVLHGVWEKTIKTGFFTDDNNATYYADENGNICKGWQFIDSHWYYFGTDGKLQFRWVNYNGSWYYIDPYWGYMSTGLKLIKFNYYYFNKNGIMVTGWQNIDGQWYYFSSSGARRTGWVQIDGYWYYFNSSGVMAPSGWQMINGVTYYFTKNGAMKIGWQEIDGTWFYFTKSGAKATGWQNINGTWYYFDLDGLMYTGWLTQGKVKYYFTPSGAMKIGWCKIDNDWYYFKPSGAMAVNEIIDGYKIGADGKMK